MEAIIDTSSPRALLRITAWAPPMLAKSTSPEMSAAIAAGPPRMNIGSICNPCALKKPRAKATRTGISLFHDKLTKTTRSNFFSCAAAVGAPTNDPSQKMSQKEIQTEAQNFFIAISIFDLLPPRIHRRSSLFIEREDFIGLRLRSFHAG